MPMLCAGHILRQPFAGCIFFDIVSDLDGCLAPRCSIFGCGFVMVL